MYKRHIKEINSRADLFCEKLIARGNQLETGSVTDRLEISISATSHYHRAPLFW